MHGVHGVCLRAWFVDTCRTSLPPYHIRSRAIQVGLCSVPRTAQHASPICSSCWRRSPHPPPLPPSQPPIIPFQGILGGKYDDLPEMAFYMIGGIQEAVDKADKLAKDVAARKDESKVKVGLGGGGAGGGAS